MVTANSLLLDDLVGSQQKRLGYCQAERLGSVEIDDQSELGGLFDRNVGWLRSPQKSCQPIQRCADTYRGSLVHKRSDLRLHRNPEDSTRPAVVRPMPIRLSETRS